MRFFVILLLIASLSACKSEKQAVSIPAESEIHFGSFGGFANAYDEYTLMLDGKLYHKTKNTASKLVTNIGKNKAEEYFTKALSLEVDKTAINHPGNMTYFIRFKGGGADNQLKWGDANFTCPKEIQDFYNALGKLRP